MVCPQELKIVETDFPHLELRASGYHAVLSGQQSWNDEDAVFIDPDDPGLH